MSIIERILCKLFPFTDIKREESGDIYLRRWFLYPRDKDFDKNKGKGRLYLHKFYRGDEDEHLHDHPWSFTSLILTRGYWEETPFDVEREGWYGMPPHGYRWCGIGESGERKRKFYPAFSLLRRPATWRHRVILKDEKPVWTLVRTGSKERSWGFWLKGVFCPWRNYQDGVCWCAEDYCPACKNADHSMHDISAHRLGCQNPGCSCIEETI